MIIDAHLHVWELSSERYPWNPLATVAPTYAWPVEREVEVMDRYGIDGGVLVQPSMYRWDNRYLLECARRYPGRFHLVGLVNPDADTVLEDMEALAAEGVQGLRLGPMLRPEMAWFNTPKTDRIWRKASDLSLILTLLVSPEQVADSRDAIRRFPGARIIVDHLARPDKASRPEAMQDLLSLAEFPQVYIKVSALRYMSREPYPHQDILAIVRQVYDRFGPQRLMWGTDTPMSQTPEGIPDALKLIDLALPGASQAEIEMIKGGTAAALFGWGR